MKDFSALIEAAKNNKLPIGILSHEAYKAIVCTGILIQICPFDLIVLHKVYHCGCATEQQRECLSDNAELLP